VKYFDARRRKERRRASVYFDERRMSDKSLEMPDRDELELSEILHALSDPIRLEIVAALAAQGEVPCGVIPLPVSDSTRSHHFKILRHAGLTETRISGTQRLVSLRRDDLEARFPGLLDSVLAATAAV
jgi:DNA-binding transcriptional ArsR family regulator